MNPRSVTRCKTLAASCAMSSDGQFCKGLTGSFSRDLPQVFATSKCCDCTSEQLNLPSPGLEELINVTRAQWHVMDSMQDYARSPKSAGDGRPQPWYSLEFVRPNVPLNLTETGETLHSTLNLLPQVSHFTLLETSGLQRAACVSLHFRRRWVQREPADGDD